MENFIGNSSQTDCRVTLTKASKCINDLLTGLVTLTYHRKNSSVVSLQMPLEVDRILQFNLILFV